MLIGRIEYLGTLNVVSSLWVCDSSPRIWSNSRKALLRVILVLKDMYEEETGEENDWRTTSQALRQHHPEFERFYKSARSTVALGECCVQPLPPLPSTPPSFYILQCPVFRGFCRLVLSSLSDTYYHSPATHHQITTYTQTTPVSWSSAHDFLLLRRKGKPIAVLILSTNELCVCNIFPSSPFTRSSIVRLPVTQAGRTMTARTFR